MASVCCPRVVGKNPGDIPGQVSGGGVNSVSQGGFPVGIFNINYK